MINGDYATLGDTADPEMGYPVLEYRKDGKDYQWIKFYDGTQTVADPFLVGKVSSTDRPYESTRVGTGVAYPFVFSDGVTRANFADIGTITAGLIQAPNGKYKNTVATGTFEWWD